MSELGRFSHGNAYSNGWWFPRDGQKVYLLKWYGDLIVAAEPDEEEVTVAYTWPRGLRNQEASRLAWRHYERKTVGR